MDDFEDQARIIGKILIEVAETGVRRRKLYFEDFDEPEEHRGLFVDCVRWLAVEDLIEVDREGSQGRFTGCCLRAKGFAFLGREIEFGDGKLRVREATKHVAAGRIDTTTAGQFLGGFFAGAVKGLGS